MSLTILGVVATLVYPPWYYRLETHATYRSGGYGWLFAPPAFRGEYAQQFVPLVDTRRLVVQLLLCVALGALVWICLPALGGLSERLLHIRFTRLQKMAALAGLVGLGGVLLYVPWLRIPKPSLSEAPLVRMYQEMAKKRDGFDALPSLDKRGQPVGFKSASYRLAVRTLLENGYSVDEIAEARPKWSRKAIEAEEDLFIQAGRMNSRAGEGGIDLDILDGKVKKKPEKDIRGPHSMSLADNAWLDALRPAARKAIPALLGDIPWDSKRTRMYGWIFRRPNPLQFNRGKDSCVAPDLEDYYTVRRDHHRLRTEIYVVLGVATCVFLMGSWLGRKKSE